MSRGLFNKLGFHHTRYSANTPLELTYRMRSGFIDKLLNRLPFANEIKAIMYQYPLGLKYVIENLRVSERIVEYPLVFENINLSAGKICDLGSASSKLPLELASLGHMVVGVDYKHQHFVHPNLSYVVADLVRLPFANGTFDRVLLISTIEHIGLGAFADPQHPDGDLRVMAEVRRIIKDNGRVLVSFLVVDSTLEYSWHGKIHNYTPRRLERLFKYFNVEKQYIFNYKDGCWILGASSDKYTCYFFVLVPT